MRWTSCALAVLGIALFTVFCSTSACNEAVCASRVSKCMLIKCCECEMANKKNCSCCRDCQVCLADLYTQCCSCVGLCAAPDPNMDLDKTSSIEDLSDPIPDLFNVLTEEEDSLKRWTTYTYPRHMDTLFFKPGSLDLSFAIAIGEDRKKDKESEKDDDLNSSKNCSVAFFSQCMSLRKCKASCKSMGAAKYRWFHGYGCCQCIGDTCHEYGLSEPKCLQCPVSEMEESLVEISDYDYQENSVHMGSKMDIKAAEGISGSN